MTLVPDRPTSPPCAFACVLSCGGLRPGVMAVVTLVALFAGGMVWPVAAVAGASEDLSIFEGEWSQIDSATTEERRERAIEDAVEGLNWVMRKMAGPQLVDSTAPPNRMQFFRKGKELRQRVHERNGERERPVALGAGGARTETDSAGSFDFEWSLSETGLHLNWKQHQAHGSNVYRVDPSTGLLVVQHTIQVTAIDDVAPIVFESRFGRQTPPAVSAEPR